jgi:hypothetical protein
MRFSLKDLMWSVTFASLGMALVPVASSTKLWDSNYPEFVLRLILSLAPGPLFGAAIGRLFNETKWGIIYGSIVELLFLLVV